MEKSRAASEYNAYVKSILKISILKIMFLELGLYEKNVTERYLGTIFTK